MIVAGTYVATRPYRYSTVYVSSTPYYYYGGTFYVVDGTRYVVVTPPPGAVVYGVPAPTTVVYAGEDPYFYYNGTYYSSTDAKATQPEENADFKGEKPEDPPKMLTSDEHNYEVVSPAVGATVPYLPKEAVEKKVGGKTYYLVDDKTWYRAYASDGDKVYMVCEDPNKSSN